MVEDRDIPSDPTPAPESPEPAAGEPETPPATPATPPAEAAGTPPKKGMSTGAKVAIGCGIAFLVGLVALVVAMVAGGMFLKKKAEDFAGGVEAQQEASEVVRELERDHAFTAPEDRVVGEDRAETFFAVTDQAWEDMRGIVEEWQERGDRMDDGRATPGDVMAGIGALGDLGRARVALAEALDDHDMPVSEYVWTGMRLSEAYGSLDASGETGVPEANRALARANRDRLAEIAGDEDEGGTGKALVLAMAWTWTGEAGIETPGR